MTAKAISKNIPVLSSALDVNNTNSTEASAGTRAGGWIPNVDSVQAEHHNFYHGASSAFLYEAQQMGLLIPFNPDGNGHSLVACPKGGIVSISDSVTNETQFYVAQVDMAVGFVDPSTDPTNWTKINFEVLAKLVPAYADATGTADAIAAAYTLAYPVLQDGLKLSIGILAPNTTPTPTFAPSLNGAVQPAWNIVKVIGGISVPLQPGDLQGTAEVVADTPNSKWILMNPASASVNTTTDATFADNSNKGVSSNWVRGAMSAIAVAAGFVSSFGTNGYVRFPSWFGNLIIQWGTVTNNATQNVATAVTFPIAFPNACYGVYNTAVGTVSNFDGAGSITTAGFNSYAINSNGVSNWFAIGH